MSFSQTVVLGAIAGFTIFLGLPLGRLQTLSATAKGFLATVSAGILLFLFWDVITPAHDILESSLVQAQSGGSWAGLALRSSTFVAGIAVGSLGLAWLEHRVTRRVPSPIAGGAVAERSLEGLDDPRRREALTLGMLIALAIGLHNFSEGLAIGVSARAGAVALASTLIIGFAAHNATEGFGIVGPLGDVRPSWRWLLAAGLVGGGPTFVGAMVGYDVSSKPLEIAFYALAAGGILYVVGQIWGSVQRRLNPTLVLGGIVLGLLLGIGTDLIVTAGGA